MRNLSRAIVMATAMTLIASACGDDDTAETQAADDPTVDDTAEETAPDSRADDDTATDGHDHDANDDAMADQDTDADHAGDEDSHSHDGNHEVSNAGITITVEAIPDAASGVNVFVTTTGFEIAPRDASGEHVDGEGHFHLYVDGEKRLRFYNEAIHVEGILDGEVEISVELSGNDHGAYTRDGQRIIASTTIDVPEHSHDAHDHGEPVPAEFAGEPPRLSIEVNDDAVSGWNAFITVDGFALSGAHASGDHVEGEGHIHLYVGDQKLMRLYGTAAHLSTLPAGTQQIRAALFTNDHRPYVIDGAPIEAATTVTVAG